MRRAASESAAAPVSHNAAGPVELNDVCRTKLKLPYQTDSDAALLPNLIHQLGSAHEWSGVWIRPKFGPRQTHSVSENAISSSCAVQFRRSFILPSRVIVKIYRFKRDNFLSENVIFESKTFLPNAQHSISLLDVRLVEKLGHLPPDR